MFKWNLTQRKKYKKNRSLQQVNSRLEQDFLQFPEEIMYKIFESMCDQSVSEIHRLIRQSIQKKEYGLFTHLHLFLGTLKHFRFTGYIHSSIKHWNEKKTFYEITRFIPTKNIVSAITITMPQPETVIYIPGHILVKRLKYKMAFIERLTIMNTTNITHLTLACVLGSPLIKIQLILACPKLTYLHFDDFNNTGMRLTDLNSLQLTTLKITGFLSVIHIDDLTNFIKGQAPTLRKLTLKIRNMANMIYKLYFGETQFPEIRKLKFLIAPDLFSQIIPPNLLTNVETVKLMIGWNGRVDIQYSLDQLLKKPNIKTITFFGRLYEYDRLIIKEYKEKIEKRNLSCKIIERKPTRKLYVNTI